MPQAVDLPVVALAVRRVQVGVTNAALLHDVPGERGRFHACDAVRGVAARADGHALDVLVRVPQPRVDAVGVDLGYADMAAPARLGDVVAMHAGFRLARGADVVGTMTVGTHRRHRQPGLLHRPSVNTVEVALHEVVSGERHVGRLGVMLVAFATDLDDVQRVGVRFPIGRRSDVVRPVTVPAPRRVFVPGGQRLRVNAPEVQVRLGRVAAGATRRGQRRRVRQRVRPGVAIVAGQLGVNAAGEDFLVKIEPQQIGARLQRRGDHRGPLLFGQRSDAELPMAIQTSAGAGVACLLRRAHSDAHPKCQRGQADRGEPR